MVQLYKIQIKWRFDLFLSGEAARESQLDRSYCGSLSATWHASFPQENSWFSLVPSHNFALEKEIQVPLQRSAMLGVILLVAFVVAPFWSSACITDKMKYKIRMSGI